LFVHGVPKGGRHVRSRGTPGGRGRKLIEAMAGGLARVSALAARQLRGVRGRVAVDGVTAVAIRPASGVGGMPFLVGAGAVAAALL